MLAKLLKFYVEKSHIGSLETEARGSFTAIGVRFEACKRAASPRLLSLMAKRT